MSPQPLSSQDWTNQEVTKYYYEYYYPPRVESEVRGWAGDLRPILFL